MCRYSWRVGRTTATGALIDPFQQMVKQAGVGDRVKFLGELDAINAWLDASDIFLLPSESKGLPLAMMEAVAKGLLIAASAVSGVPEGLGDTGQLLTSPMFGNPVDHSRVGCDLEGLGR